MIENRGLGIVKSVRDQPAIIGVEESSKLRPRMPLESGSVALYKSEGATIFRSTAGDPGIEREDGEVAGVAAGGPCVRGEALKDSAGDVLPLGDDEVGD